MTNWINRRNFLKTTGALGAGVGILGLGHAPLCGAEPAKGAPHAEKLGWRLGCQAYTFKSGSFFQAVDNNASLGLKCIEAYPGQAIGGEVKGNVGPETSTDARKAIKQKLADSGVKVVCFGVCGLSKNPADARKTFDFAKDMGIETLTSEPAEDAMENLDKLCEEYGINVALHNHPKPSHYWDPDTVLKACKGRSKRMGACADTGHWMRSGLNPIECLKKLEGRIISFHFKDLNKQGGGAHDVPWGTGKNDVKGMLTEIHRQGIKAVFSIEYEHNWGKAMPELAKCVQYFDQVAAEIAAKG